MTATQRQNIQIALSKKWVVDVRNGKTYSSPVSAIKAFGLKSYNSLLKVPHLVILEK